MKYSIDLQSPFAFSPYWYALGIALIVLALLLRFGFNRLFAVKMDSPFRIDKLRRDCLRQVDGSPQVRSRCHRTGDRNHGPGGPEPAGKA